MKKYILGAVLSLGILIFPALASAQTRGLTDSQATVLINVVKSSPSTPANAFVNLITAFSGVTDNQAASLIVVVQASPTTPTSAFIPLLTSFTTTTSAAQTTTTTAISTTMPVTNSNQTITTIPAVPVDVFLIAGQSNAVGYGTASQSPVPPAGKVLEYYNGTISDATDPVGNANTGSAWPAFGIAYYNATGHNIVLVPAAVPSSGQTAASDTGTGNWGASGTLFDASTDKLGAAMSALAAAHYAPTFKGVLWDQGENDAMALNEKLATANDYRTALTGMIGRYRARYGSTIPFYIFETGTSPAESDAGYAAVRAVQAQVPASDPYTRVVFQSAVGFPSRGLMKDSYHYTQAGYNEMGTVGAQNILSSGVVVITPVQTSTPSPVAPVVPVTPVVTVTPSTPTATYAPTSASITSGGYISNSSYSSTNASYCNVYDNTSGADVLSWGNAPTSWAQSNMGPYAASFSRKLICYSSTGVASDPAYFTLTANPVVTTATTPAPVVTAPTASWSPTSATITSSGYLPSASFSSTNASYCNVYDNDTGALSWGNAPTSWAQSNMGPYAASFSRKLICYSSTGVASAPAYFNLTVTN